MISWCRWRKHLIFDVQLAAFQRYLIIILIMDITFVTSTQIPCQLIIYTHHASQKKKVFFVLFCFHCICFWSTWALRHFQRVLLYPSKY